MLVKILFLYIILISPSFLYSQSFHITKIIETNLFELDNNQLIKFYGLYIPSRKDTNQSIAKIANEIYEWEKDFMLDRSFKIDFLNKDKNDIWEVIIYRSYALSDENLANRLLSIGYASLLTNTNSEYYSQLIS